MDPMAEEQLDYEDEEYGGAQKMPFQGGGAISALADDELMGEDDEYDDLYNDVNVGEGFLQMHRSEAPAPSGVMAGGPFQAHKTDVPPQKVEAGTSQGLIIPGVSIEGKYSNPHFHEKKEGPMAVKGPEMGSTSHLDGPSVSQKGRVLEMTHDTQVRNLGFQGSTPIPQKTGAEPSDVHGKIANESTPVLNSGTGGPRGVPQMLSNQMGMNVNVNRPMVNENQIRPAVDNGATMLFVGELHWWTTDAELESVLSQYGRVKEIKFFDERASGKSKGYCQVEFYDASAAAACKEGMNGYIFNGRACVVAFASPQTLKQMGAKNMVGNTAGVGASGGGYGQGLAGPTFGGPAGGLMHPQGMMGTGFDPTYMGRGGGYGGFSGSAFPGMVPSFPAVNTMGLAGVAPHVNPAFFGRGMATNGMGMMGATGMDGHHAGMWTDTSMGGWGGEEHGRRTRESSYGGDDGASDYGYGEVNHEKVGRSNTASREKERGSERDWSGNSERRHRDEREQDWERSDKDHRYREEKDGYRDHRQRERDFNNEDDWDRGQSSSRSRSRSRAVADEDHRSRSRDGDYGKRRRLPSE